MKFKLKFHDDQYDIVDNPRLMEALESLGFVLIKTVKEWSKYFTREIIGCEIDTSHEVEKDFDTLEELAKFIETYGPVDICNEINQETNEETKVMRIYVDRIH